MFLIIISINNIYCSCHDSGSYTVNSLCINHSEGCLPLKCSATLQSTCYCLLAFHLQAKKSGMKLLNIPKNLYKNILKNFPM